MRLIKMVITLVFSSLGRNRSLGDVRKLVASVAKRLAYMS